jgi:hypothetical protein
MWKWVQSLDSVLRGDVTRLSRLREGQVSVPIGGLTVLIILLGAFYGLCIGCFAVFNRPMPQYTQLLASTIKVPALFLLTLLVTLPSLYFPRGPARRDQRPGGADNRAGVAGALHAVLVRLLDELRLG